MKRRVAGHGRRFGNDLYHHRVVQNGLVEHLNEAHEDDETLSTDLLALNEASFEDEEMTHLQMRASQKGVFEEEPDTDEDEDDILHSPGSWLSNVDDWIDEHVFGRAQRLGQALSEEPNSDDEDLGDLSPIY